MGTGSWPLAIKGFRLGGKQLVRLQEIQRQEEQAANSRGAGSLGMLSTANAAKHCFGRQAGEARESHKKKTHLGTGKRASQSHPLIQWLKLEAGQTQPDVR